MAKQTAPRVQAKGEPMTGARLPQPAISDESDSGLWTVHQGDAREVRGLLQRVSQGLGASDQPFLQTTITSPPYATLVDYGSVNQIGFGQTYEDYLESCKSVFQAIFDWTLDTGSMWVVADSLMQKQSEAFLPSKFIPLPFDLAAKASSVGWTLREVIVWRKDRTRPWSHRGKLRNGFEYVLFFVKTNDFKFNVDKLRETATLKSWWVKYPERHNPWGMTPDNVWEIPIPVQGSWDDSAFPHACPFPPELVRRMVTLASDEGDVVFDPFAGSGTVVSGAISEGRRGLGIELNSSYVELFQKVAPVIQTARQESATVGVMTQRLLELRMLKYPKDLANQLLREGFTSSQVRAVLMTVESINYKPSRSAYGKISCFVVAAKDLSEHERARLDKTLGEVAAKAPLSKYGLTVKLKLVSADQASSKVRDSQVSVYTRGRTWYADRVLDGSDVKAWLKGLGATTVVPVLSPLHVRQSLEESN